MSRSRLLVFDLDGTLIDSSRDLADSANEMLAHYGGAPLAERAIISMVGAGAPQLVARVLRAAAIEKLVDEALPLFLDSYDRRLTRHTRPYAGIPELLQSMDEAGMQMSVLTNKPLWQTTRILDTLNLAEFFDHCLGGDGPWPRKPAPDALNFLMREAAVGPDATTMIGDSSVDLQTARNASVRICLARYGFGFVDIDPALLRGDELIVDHPREIAAVAD
jgi:phosphoglycolate phosphatase